MLVTMTGTEHGVKVTVLILVMEKKFNALYSTMTLRFCS